MGALAAKHLVRAGVERIEVVNRSLPRARRLANNIKELGVEAHAHVLDDISAVLVEADVVMSSTGAVRPVVSLADVHHALARRRPGGSRPARCARHRHGPDPT